ncbi:hypothetical protein BVRB_9g211580 [Beta vulgaris subsp. vulgaris]|nr:hypothetical protein BVRB_9g211580 [Beta vulgaris subsp. vulgaris]
MGLKLVNLTLSKRKRNLSHPPMNRPPIVCGLRVLGSNESSIPIKNGKAIDSEVKMEIGDDSNEDQSFPWEGMYIRDATFAEGRKCHDMFCEDADGKFRLFKVYEDNEECYDDEDPEIPLSPCREGEELDPEQHSFLLLRKGTQRSP